MSSRKAPPDDSLFHGPMRSPQTKEDEELSQLEALVGNSREFEPSAGADGVFQAVTARFSGIVAG